MTQPENPMPMRPYRLLFSVADRDGNPVRLDEEQWEGHVISRHPEVEPYLEEIQQAINDPEIVTIDDNGAYHYSRFGAVSSRQRQYLIVVVTYSDEITGRRLGSVRTAYFRGRPPAGQRIC